DEVCRPGYREALVAFLEERAGDLCDEHRERWRLNPLRVLDCKRPECRAVTEEAPKTIDFLCEPCRKHFDAVRTGLTEEDISFQIDHRLVRGLDYYTRTAFEFTSPRLGPTQSTICGGGRYDGLAEALGGEPTPGVGFGLGLERVLLVMEEEGSSLPEEAGGVFVVALGEEARRIARGLVRELRDAGVRAELALEERPLKAQLKMADRTGAYYAGIVGEEELQDGVITLRTMTDGTQERIKQAELIEWLSR
ncbi:MAG TPA: His/Gly/Thr/Pro-type tRNA ligase C-terminal domain-containing protein, partial [Actinomycetota bacterium]|nr:His/Gly/Thr/Pro-type tRNA ligase C-terminal domain-containing protein [Actinomycetota bacterium]